MKKGFKIIGILVLCLLLIWVLLIAVDCIRLKNAERGTHPFITINVKDYENGNEYTGLGYSVKYYRIDNTFGYGTEIKLFDNITLYKNEAQ